jgi:hypothetical protein
MKPLLRAGGSDGGCSTPEEMQNEHHDTDYQQNVNDAGGDMEGEKPCQPENNQDQCD